MIKTDLSTLKIHKLTKEQYDRELAAGRIDEHAIYLTPDEGIDLSILATKEELAKKADSSDVPTKTSELTNDCDFLDESIFSKHCWKRYPNPIYTFTDQSKSYSDYSGWIIAEGLPTRTFSYGKSISVTRDGVVLDDPTVVTWDYYKSTFDGEDHFYFTPDPNTIKDDLDVLGFPLYLQYETINDGFITLRLDGNTFGIDSSDTTTWKVTVSGSNVIYHIDVDRTPCEDVSLLFDDDPNKYPQTSGGVESDDGYTYYYLGKLGEQIGSSMQVCVGFYTGTGTSGSSNPNSLTFPFVPYEVSIQAERTGGGKSIVTMSRPSTLLRWYNQTSTGGSIEGDLELTWDGCNLSWYNSSFTYVVDGQLNTEGVMYKYMAKGGRELWDI